MSDQAPVSSDAKATTSDESPLAVIKPLAGAVAGIITLVYVTGGLVLGLRLAFAGIPSLGVVGQLPHDFLFSIGATQVIGPAIVIGAAAGVLELGQSDVRLRRGHLPWSEVRGTRDLRRAYVRFYAVMPVVLVAPGAAFALCHRAGLDDRPAGLIVLGVLLVAAVLWLAWAWHSGGVLLKEGTERAMTRREDVEDTGADVEQRVTADRQDDPQTVKAVVGRDTTPPGNKIEPREWVQILSGGTLAAAVGLWVGVDGGTWSFFGLVPAWALAILVVLLVTWLRGEIGTRFRADPERGVTWTVASWSATALLMVPLFIVLAAALPLQAGVVCGRPPASGNSLVVRGSFVGETGDRVYIGEPSTGRIESVPSDEVERVIFGHGRASDVRCRGRFAR